MGCATSKKKVGDSALHPPVKTIEVASNEKEVKMEAEQPAAEDASSNHSQDLQSKKDPKTIEGSNGEKNNNNTEGTANIVHTQLLFVKREENDEGAEMDVSTLNEIIINSTSKNVKEIIKILGSVSYEHRQLIRKKYQELYSKDLLEEIVLNEDKDIETGLKTMLRNHAELLSYFMRQSIKKKDYRTLVEIFTAWPSEILALAKEKYKDDQRVEFLEDVMNSLGEILSEEQKSILISLASLERNDESVELDENVLNEECEELSQGAKSIVDVFSTKPYSRTQLKSIFGHFKSKYYMDITESIEIEFQDEITETVLNAIVGIVNDTPLYFAKQLNEMCSQQPVSIDRLLFVIIGRQPMDLPDVIQRYKEISASSLVDALTKNHAQLENHIKDLLLLIIERSKTA